MIKGIDHIALAVRDIETAGQFLKEALGLEIESIEKVPGQGVKVALINLFGVSLELIEPLDENSHLNKYLEKKGPGIHHLALKTDGLKDTLDDLKKKGIRLINDTPLNGAHGKKIAFIHPANILGTLIELSQKDE
ncbi:methylmalonyl-CoA epimerase [bacterium]|nr:methylmalonyl-CoA epimerase [bacterium]